MTSPLIDLTLQHGTCQLTFESAEDVRVVLRLEDGKSKYLVHGHYRSSDEGWRLELRSRVETSYKNSWGSDKYRRIELSKSRLAWIQAQFDAVDMPAFFEMHEAYLEAADARVRQGRLDGLRSWEATCHEAVEARRADHDQRVASRDARVARIEEDVEHQIARLREQLERDVAAVDQQIAEFPDVIGRLEKDLAAARAEVEAFGDVPDPVALPVLSY